MRKARTTVASVSVVAALGLGLGLGPVAASADDRDDRSRREERARGEGRDRGDELEVIGLAGDRTLVEFDTDDPGDAEVLGEVRRLETADQDLVGIDYRVQDGKLYGVGRGGGVYTIDPETQQATKVLQLTIALQGTSFGVDFNPAANALRIVSDAGQNLRQPFATPGAPTVADTPLTTPPAPGTTTGVTGAAYTNNDLDPATATTLYDLATVTNQVVIQSPANAGMLAPTGATPVDLVGDTGFDIYSKVDDGKTVELFPYAVNAGRLYDVELFNGQLDDAGRIGDGSFVVTDLAIPLNQL